MTKTSEPRVLRPRRAAPADAVRLTRAEINLASLRHNLRVVQRHAGQAKIWAVLKADGYGHGAPAVARTLERAGVNGFCVALLEEGIELREAGITAPILVMGGYYGSAQAEVLARGLTPVVYDEAQLEAFARLVRSGEVRGPVDVHVKIDTGMSRLGITLDELPDFAVQLRAYEARNELTVRGLMTHLAQADALSPEETQSQIALFDEATAFLRERGVVPEVRHAANSAAVLRSDIAEADARFDAVRPGIALFGVAPPLITGDEAPRSSPVGELRPVMRVRSEIIDLREIPAGGKVGYGALWRAPRRSRIATIAMGYADGLSRQLSNKGHVLVRGKRAAIVGAVSMDMVMIDVTDHEGVSVRDEAVVLGSQEGPLGRDVISTQEIAGHVGTIAWEVLTSISRRVPRFYREP
ncbi:alanine racemase [Pendulispora albinea]|uniref:Alanine racemase n=1 Tax=Pendulispora albinea TaxID=2741071 RepID=A0ABZ2LNJ2_9BACT